MQKSKIPTTFNDQPLSCWCACQILQCEFFFCSTVCVVFVPCVSFSSQREIVARLDDVPMRYGAVQVNYELNTFMGTWINLKALSGGKVALSPAFLPWMSRQTHGHSTFCRKHVHVNASIMSGHTDRQSWTLLLHCASVCIVLSTHKYHQTRC